MTTEDHVKEAARTALRKHLAPLGPAAVQAVDAPACEETVRCYSAALWKLSIVFHEFDGSDTAALNIENAAADYRVALRLFGERARLVALETLGTGRPQ